MSMQMQSLLVHPVSAYTNNGSKLTRMAYPIGFNPLMGKQVNNVGVKCMSDQRPKGEPKIDTTSSPITPKSDPTIITSPPFIPEPKQEVSTDFMDIFAFSGPAPERINGRLAMIGFVAAIATELYQGKGLFSQISDGGASWFLVTSILLSVASLVPLFLGFRAETKTTGVMNHKAELWNGRFAMIGLVALAVTEFAKGSALV